MTPKNQEQLPNKPTERQRLKAEVEKVLDDLKMLYRNNTEGLLFLKELKKRLGI